MPDWLSILLALLGGAAALLGAVAASRSAQIAQQALALSQEQAAPNVVVSVTREIDARTFVFIEAKNTGNSHAFNVNFDIYEKLTRHFGFGASSQDHGAELTGTFIQNGIPVLAPGESRKVLWGQIGALLEILSTNQIRVTAEFADSQKTLRKTESILEVSSFKKNHAGDNRPITRLVKEIRELHETLKVALLRDGIIVEDKASRDLRDEVWEERYREQQRENTA